MTHTITLPVEEPGDIIRRAGAYVLGQLALFDGHRPHHVRLQITGTITLDQDTAIDLASRPLGDLVTLADIIDQAAIVRKTYARPPDDSGNPAPLEQTITLRILPAHDEEADPD